MMKKVFLNREILKLENVMESCRNLFPPEKISAQIQGMKKQNHEIFGVFQNRDRFFSPNIFFQKKKNF